MKWTFMDESASVSVPSVPTHSTWHSLEGRKPLLMFQIKTTVASFTDVDVCRVQRNVGDDDDDGIVLSCIQTCKYFLLFILVPLSLQNMLYFLSSCSSSCRGICASLLTLIVLHKLIYISLAIEGCLVSL